MPAQRQPGPHARSEPAATPTKEARDWRSYRWLRHSRRAGDEPIPVSGMLGTIIVSGDLAAMAEEYIRRAPAQVRTDYRAAIERALGWTPVGDGAQP